MKALILINGAPEHRPFYSKVGDELVRRGHDVVYAVDSHYTDVIYPSAALHQPARYFSDYFRKHEMTARVPAELASENLWLAMFPDFDRFNSTAVAGSESAWRKTPGYSPRARRGHELVFHRALRRAPPDCVVYEGVSNAFAYMAFIVAEKRGARYLGFAPARMPNRTVVSTTRFHFDGRLPVIYDEIRRGKRVVPPAARAAVEEHLRASSRPTPTTRSRSTRSPRIRSSAMERGVA